MSAPESVRTEIKHKLWAEAKRLNWPALSTTDKSRYYDVWTDASDIGGRLGQYMDPLKVRVYIKDTIIKPYAREASANPERIFRVLSIRYDEAPRAIFNKPHGLILPDGRQIAWSKASEWKTTLMSLHERCFNRNDPYAVVLLEAGAKFNDCMQRDIVEDAARKLEIKIVKWLD